MRGVSWTALLKLRGIAENTAMARLALGSAASERQVISLANYFSRVLNGRVPKVSAKVLGQLAQGLGYTSMSTFYADWERVTADQPPRRQQRPPRAMNSSGAAEPFIQNDRGDSPAAGNRATRSSARKRSHAQTPTDSPPAVPLDPTLAAAQQLKVLAETCIRLSRTLADQSPPGTARDRSGVGPRHRQRSRARARG